MESILLSLTLALGVGRLAAHLCSTRVKLPSVVGEIFAGIVLVNLGLLPHLPFLDHLAEIGVVLLLFLVGLEGDFRLLLRSGVRSFLVAIVGVLTPFLLVFAFSAVGLLNLKAITLAGVSPALMGLFIGATLTATSVGITARILSEANQLNSKTGQVILGAAIIDDVLGLIVLSVVSALAANSVLSWDLARDNLLHILRNIAIFIFVALPLGYFVFSRFLKLARKAEMILVSGLVSCFSFAWISMKLGLAPIVGSFFAGILSDDSQEHVQKKMEPVVDFLAPLFFVLIGAQIDLRVLLGSASLQFLGLTLVLIIAAIFGKLACGLVSGPGTNRRAVAWGMTPRGEVGLIFAMTGKQSGVISQEVFAVLVLVVLLSTVVPSIMLSRQFRKARA